MIKIKEKNDLVPNKYPLIFVDCTIKVNSYTWQITHPFLHIKAIYFVSCS